MSFFEDNDLTENLIPKSKRERVYNTAGLVTALSYAVVILIIVVICAKNKFSVVTKKDIQRRSAVGGLFLLLFWVILIHMLVSLYCFNKRTYD